MSKELYISKEIAVYDPSTGANDVSPEFNDFVNKNAKRGYVVDSVTNLHGEKFNVDGKNFDGSHLFVVMYHKKSLTKLLAAGFKEEN